MENIPVDITKYGNKNYIRAVHGTQFKDMPQYADLLARSGEDVPWTARSRGDVRPKGRALPYEYYTDPRYVAQESKKIWMKSWQVACREEDIPEVGDRIAYDVGKLSFLVVRSGPSEFKAFFNSCRHRGRRLCEAAKESGDTIQCAFHAWSFDLEGKLTWVPRWEEFKGVTPKTHSLRPVQCDTWGGNVFINPDPSAGPLAEALGVMPQHFQDCPQEQRYTAAHIKKKARINWKSAMEAFLEGYHVLTTHPSGMPIFGSTYTQTDCWNDGSASVSRLITPALVPDGWVEGEVTPRISLELFCNTYALPMPPEGRGATVADARAYAAEKIVEKRRAESGTDFGDRPISYLVDMHQWFVFPAHFPWWGEGLSWWYNFTPIGDNPGECMMEVRWLLPMPKDGSQPQRARTVHIDFDEMARDYPETGQVGYILDEDMVNMEQVQRGMDASDPEVAYPVLADMQESRIQHFHDAYMRAMGI